MKIDPLSPMYPHYTPYSFSGNKVISFVELEGLEEKPVVHYYNMVKNDAGEYKPVLNHSSSKLVMRGANVTYKNNIYGGTADISGLGKGNYKMTMYHSVGVYTYWNSDGTIKRQVVKSNAKLFDSYVDYPDERLLALKNGTTIGEYDPGDRNQLARGVGKTIAYSGHAILDGVGLIPVIGEPADGLNAGWYALEGNYTDATLSSLAMVPFVGGPVTLGKWGRNVLKFADNAFHSSTGLIFRRGSQHGNRLSHAAAHLYDDVSKPIHGVFSDADDVVGTLDDAWGIATKGGDDVVKTTSNGRDVYVIDMKKKVGWEGGSAGSGQDLYKIKIVVKEGTSEVITGYPTR